MFSGGVDFMRNALIVVWSCISYSLSRRKNVIVKCDLTHAYCLSLRR